MSNNQQMVMLIDDNIIDLTISSKLIQFSKLFDEIIVFQSGDEALNYIKTNLKQPNLLPRFILLDIQMPEMDGFEFLNYYKKLPTSFTDKCQIAMLSSTLDFGDINKAEANHYVVKLLRKPLSTTELQKLL
ncbi:MAG: response regulator [Bacteroidota bacterium]